MAVTRLTVVSLMTDANAIHTIAVSIAAQLHAVHCHHTGTAPVACLAEVTIGTFTLIILLLGIITEIRASSMARALHNSTIDFA